MASKMKPPEPTGEVHPVADLFPMMTDDELDDLAADIKANGLLSPIVLDENGVLIDGRNRLVGCLRAEVQPTFTALNGHEPVAFIISSNVARRHLNKGQAAMAVAKSQSLLGKDWDGRKGRAAKSIGASASRISQAVTVLDYAPHLTESVLLGAISLNEAYEEARRHKEGQESEAERKGREQAEARIQLIRLRSECPELAVKVQEGELTLAGALAEWEERQRQEREQISAVTKMLDTGLNYLDPRHWDVDTHVRGWLKADPHRLGEQADFSAERARRVAAALLRYAEIKEREDV